MHEGQYRSACPGSDPRSRRHPTVGGCKISTNTRNGGQIPAGGSGLTSSLGLRTIARSASGLSVAGLLSSGLSLPATFLAARWLGPDAFGRAQYVLLFFVYGSLVRSGVFEGGMRAFIHLRGRGEEDEALRSQNAGLSYELIVSLIPGLVLLLVAFWSDDPIQRLGFLVAPVAVMASSGASFLSAIFMARGQIEVVTHVTVARAVVFPAALLGGIAVLGTRGAILAPVFADLLVVAAYSRRAGGFGIRLSFDRGRGWALTRTGFPLGAKAIVYWTYRLVGGTSVAVALPAAAFGAFAFASAPLALLGKAFASVNAVLMPALWGEMARNDRTGWANDAARIAVALAVGAGVATNLAQAGFAPVVTAYLPRFVDSIDLFDLLVLNVLLLSLDAVPALVLDSVAVNRQTLHLKIWIGGLTINVVANVVALWRGFGAHAIAFNDVWVQLAVVIALHVVAARYLSGKRWRCARRRLVAITIVTAAVSVGLHVGPQAAEGLAEVSVLVAARAVVVVGVWTIVALTLRRWFQPSQVTSPSDA